MKKLEVVRLSWDSNFFDLEIGKLELKRGDLISKSSIKEISKKYDLVYIFSEEDVSSVIDIEPIDKKAVFELNINNSEAIKTSLNDFAFSKENYEELLELVYLSGKYSRYKLDKSFLDGAFKKLYKAWIDKSLDKSFFGKVFIKRVDEKIAGFITVEIGRDQKASIGLIAVSEEFQGMGIARELIMNALSFSQDNSMKVLQVATQSENIPAVKLYLSCGFYLVCETNIYHYWK